MFKNMPRPIERPYTIMSKYSDYVHSNAVIDHLHVQCPYIYITLQYLKSYRQKQKSVVLEANILCL